MKLGHTDIQSKLCKLNHITCIHVYKWVLNFGTYLHYQGEYLQHDIEQNNIITTHVSLSFASFSRM